MSQFNDTLGHTALGRGFADPVGEAQRVFRAVMDATARPGSIRQLSVDLDAPQPMMPGAAALALALFDHDTPVWRDALLRTTEIDSWLRFHTGAPLTDDAASAAFALIGDPASLAGFDRFAQGTSEYPDQSTTLILQLDTLTEGRPLSLSGPGIKGTTGIAPSPLPPHLLDWLAVNQASFPRGIDLVLVAASELASLPRTTIVKPMEA